MPLAGEPIAILGVFRSGTSCLANALNDLGVYLGEQHDFYPANENNLGGYWEIKSLQELNVRGYAVFGMNFYQVSRLPSDWIEYPGSKVFAKEIRALLNEKFLGKTHWGWKEPATTGLVPLYRYLLGEEGITPRFAICVRHPSSVAASQLSRQRKWGLEISDEDIKSLNHPIAFHTIGLWLHYTLTALRETKGHKRLVISYEHFLDNASATIEDIRRVLLTHEPTSEQVATATAAVKPEWSHNKYTVDDLKQWPDLVARTYDCCLRAFRDPNSLNSGAFDDEVEALYAEFGRMTKMLQPIQLPGGQFTLNWMQGNSPAGFGEKFTPTGGWQTMRIESAAPASSQVQLDLYQTPCQIWIRKAVWVVDGVEHPAPIGPGPNGVIEDLFGRKRLTIFGPGPAFTQMPASSPATFEMEFQVQSGPAILNTVVSMLRSRIDQVKSTAKPNPGGFRL